MFTLGILTVSDKGARGEREDESGRAIEQALAALGAHLVKYDVVPDEPELISGRLVEWADVEELDLIVTTGGTGLGPRDVTPEATLKVVERVAPGFAEAMRMEGLKQTPLAMLSRAACGIRGGSLIVNLPGSPKAVRECLEAIMPALPHAIEILRGEGGECGQE